jgi:phospholipid transport system transporter-binding protein
MISCEGGRCTVQGPLTMDCVTAVLEESSTLFRGPDLIVDLGPVTEVDSAAVSLLLEWQRAARRENRAIRFVNVPANLLSLARLYGVAELIPGAA